MLQRKTAAESREGENREAEARVVASWERAAEDGEREVGEGKRGAEEAAVQTCTGGRVSGRLNDTCHLCIVYYS